MAHPQALCFAASAAAVLTFLRHQVQSTATLSTHPQLLIYAVCPHSGKVLLPECDNAHAIHKQPATPSYADGSLHLVPCEHPNFDASITQRLKTVWNTILQAERQNRRLLVCNFAQHLHMRLCNLQRDAFIFTCHLGTPAAGVSY